MKLGCQESEPDSLSMNCNFETTVARNNDTAIPGAMIQQVPLAWSDCFWTAAIMNKATRQRPRLHRLRRRPDKSPEDRSSIAERNCCARNGLGNGAP